MHGAGAAPGSWGPGGFGPWLGAMAGAAMRGRGGRGGHGGHGGPRGPWGFGPGGRGGFGFPFPFPGPPFRGGPRAKRGDVRAAALALIAEQPMNGYQIIEEIARRSGGVWRPSSGSVYPALQQLEDEGLIRAEQVEGRRLFHLTDAGQTYVEEHGDELAAPWETVTDGMGETFELQELVAQVAMAFIQVARAGSPDQLNEAREVLNETRRQLYRILAEGDSGTGDEV